MANRQTMLTSLATVPTWNSMAYQDRLQAMTVSA